MNKKIGKNTKNLKVVFAFCLGVVLSATGVYAATQIAADTVSFTSKSGLTSTNIQDAIDEVYTAKNTCPEDKICYKKICRRATTLHTEECSYTGCQKAGYTSTGSKKTTTITYGNLGTRGTLNVGDAFDCDVNGDGKYDPGTERFYYVSDHYNTKNKTFNDKFAALIYYSNTVKGEIYKENSTSINYTNVNAASGPTYAVKWLPTTSQWKNITITGGDDKTRQILNEDATTTTQNGLKLPLFDYSGYAARLLTYQEAVKACPDLAKTFLSDSSFVNAIDSCRFLFEKTQFSKLGNWHTNYWLETVAKDDSSEANAFYLGSFLSESQLPSKAISTFSINSGTGEGGYRHSPGVRPVIEMNKNYIEY